MKSLADISFPASRGQRSSWNVVLECLHFVYPHGTLYYSLVLLYMTVQVHDSPRREAEAPRRLPGLEPHHHISDQRPVNERHYGAGRCSAVSGNQTHAPDRTQACDAARTSACTAVLKPAEVCLYELTCLACLTHYLMWFWQVCNAPAACVGSAASSE